MISKVLAAIATAMTIVVVSQPGLRAQGQSVPTLEALAASEEAQRHIATAMGLAGSDLVNEAEALCSPAGPRRAGTASSRGREPSGRRPPRAASPVLAWAACRLASRASTRACGGSRP